MSLTYSVKTFPTFPIRAQLFHVPGAAFEAGYTTGGARITSPEPGGFSILEIQPALQVNEWSYPAASWLMSQASGQIMRLRLAPTPQIVRAGAGVTWDDGVLWSNNETWDGDVVGVYESDSLAGTQTVTIDMSLLGQVLQQGHVIGHDFSAYKVDAISYDADNIATVTVVPPLRKNVTAGDIVFFRPYFTGQIINASDFRTTYDASENGNIQLGKIVMTEVLL